MCSGAQATAPWSRLRGASGGPSLPCGPSTRPQVHWASLTPGYERVTATQQQQPDSVRRHLPRAVPGAPLWGRPRARPVGVRAVPEAGVDMQVAHVFSLVCEALAEATDALLGGGPVEASKVVAADERVDELTGQLSEAIWGELARLVGLLLVLPELERSADLAEHIAQRAVSNLGTNMSPLSRGIVQRMSEVALEMWRSATSGYVRGEVRSDELDQADEELDILSQRLTSEVATAAMPAPVAAQVTLLGRFYERLGDHAVNLARRIELFLASGCEAGARLGNSGQPTVPPGNPGA